MLNLNERLYSREESAYIYLIDKYSRLLWREAWKILNTVASEQDVEDCISGVFLKLWKNPEKFDSTRGNIKNYLVLLVKSAAIDLYRNKIKNKEVLLDEYIPNNVNILEQTIKKEQIKDLYEALLSLTPFDREVIERRYLNQEKPSEISENMNIPVRKVENRLYRAKQKLRENMAYKQNMNG